MPLPQLPHLPLRVAKLGDREPGTRPSVVAGVPPKAVEHSLTVL